MRTNLFRVLCAVVLTCAASPLFAQSVMRGKVLDAQGKPVPDAVVLFEAHFKRNYIHVRDVARAFIHAIDNFEAMKGQSYNVGLSDANLSKAELCQRIQKHLPKFVFLEAPIGEDPDKRDYIVSNERIAATGWRPRYSLDEGIQELIKAFRIVQQNAYTNV